MSRRNQNDRYQNQPYQNQKQINNDKQDEEKYNYNENNQDNQQNQTQYFQSTFEDPKRMENINQAHNKNSQDYQKHKKYLEQNNLRQFERNKQYQYGNYDYNSAQERQNNYDHSDRKNNYSKINNLKNNENEQIDYPKQSNQPNVRISTVNYQDELDNKEVSTIDVILKKTSQEKSVKNRNNNWFSDKALKEMKIIQKLTAYSNYQQSGDKSINLQILINKFVFQITNENLSKFRVNAVVVPVILDNSKQIYKILPSISQEPSIKSLNIQQDDFKQFKNDSSCYSLKQDYGKFQIDYFFILINNDKRKQTIDKLGIIFDQCNKHQYESIYMPLLFDVEAFKLKTQYHDSKQSNQLKKFVEEFISNIKKIFRDYDYENPKNLILFEKNKVALDLLVPQLMSF